jgi:hypothetical protein
MISQNFIQGKAFPFFFFFFSFFSWSHLVPGVVYSKSYEVNCHVSGLGQKKKKQIQPLLEGRDEER